MNSQRTAHHQDKAEPDSHVPFGLRREVRDDGTIVEKLYEPTQVENAEECDCICPDCYRPLIAKANKVDFEYKRKPHFAHKPGENCAYARESAIHLAAKQLIEEHKKLFIPEKLVKVSEVDAFGKPRPLSRCLHIAGQADLLSVRLEKNIADFRPDLIVKTVNGTEMIVEIVVTHPVDDVKKRKIANIGLPAIEIDLSKIAVDSFSELEKALFKASEHSEWLFHPMEASTESELCAELEQILKDAQEEKKRREALRLKQLYEQEAKKQEQAKIEADKKANDLKKAADFKVMSSKHKLEKILSYLKIQENEIPWFLNFEVRGELSFGVPRKIWQLVIFSKFIEKGNESFNQENVLQCIKDRFTVVGEFPNSEKVAVWEFLFNLSEIGVLEHLGKQQFEIKINDLKRLVSMNVAKPIAKKVWQIPVSHIQSSNVAWVEEWPKEPATQIVKRYQNKYGSVCDWERIAGLFPNAREKSVDEVVDRFVLRRKALKADVLKFMLEVGFLRLAKRK